MRSGTRRGTLFPGNAARLQGYLVAESSNVASVILQKSAKNCSEPRIDNASGYPPGRDGRRAKPHGLPNFSPAVQTPSPRLARISGYALLACILGAGAFFAAFALREFRDPGNVIRVRFPSVSTLSEGDAVVENGVETGRVERIILGDDGSAIVELRLYRRELPALDARFVNFSHSLMGARKVWIRPGDSPLPLDPARIQDGVFVPGLPDALHRVRLLGERIAEWGEAFDRLLGGGDSSTVLRAVGEAERALARAAELEASLRHVSDSLRAGVEELAGFEKLVAGSATAADTGIGGAARSFAAAGPALVALEADLASALSRLEAMTAALGSDGVAGRLLADRAPYDSLAAGVNRLAALARAFREEGLGDSLKIRPRFRREKR